MTDDERRTAAPVLVGIDFSPGCEAALDWALDTAIAFDAPLLALHVAHDPAESPGTYARTQRGNPEELERVARDMMDEFISKARERLPRFDELRSFDTSVVLGLPVTRILEVAERENARLIVMGARERPPLADVLLGSKIERIVRLAPMAVAVVKNPATTDPPDQS